MLLLLVTLNRNALNGCLPAQRNRWMRLTVGRPLTRGRKAIHSSVEPGWKSHSISTPSLGLASAQFPARTAVLVPDNMAMTASVVSGMPLSARTFRMSAAIPRLSAIRFTLAVLVSAGL